MKGCTFAPNQGLIPSQSQQNIGFSKKFSVQLTTGKNTGDKTELQDVKIIQQNGTKQSALNTKRQLLTPRNDTARKEADQKIQKKN